MKVIGMGASHGEYIVTVTHAELSKLSERYYGPKELPLLKVGQEMDLGAGYDFRNDIQRACKQVADASKAFGQAQDTMLKFAVMVGQLPAEAVEVPAA
ncbi:MAG: hypothetical protein V4718_04260 [Pseudomonadota bacterium]